MTQAYEITMPAGQSGRIASPLAWLRALRDRFMALLEIPTALLGIPVGLIDLLSAPWLISRMLGLILLLLGILVLAGTVPIAFYRRPVDVSSGKRMGLAEAARRRTLSESAERLILAGAVAGMVIDVILVLNALHYDNARAWLFGLCGLPCLYIARRYYDWALLKQYRKLAATAGVASGLLSIVPFLYNTIYLPSTADVAVESSMIHAAPVSAGPGLQVVDLQINLQVKSSVPAVTLTSMLVVHGLSSTSTLITLRRVVRDGAILNPNVTYNTVVPVLVPARRYQELDVELMLWFARSDRLTLTSEYFGPRAYPSSRQCPGDDVRSAWLIAQSRLSLLTRGRETAVTDWCSAVTDPWVESFIGGAPGAHTSSKVARLEAQNYQAKYTSRFWAIELPDSS
jgi:hypothetical protein